MTTAIFPSHFKYHTTTVHCLPTLSLSGDLNGDLINLKVDLE